MKPRVLTQYRVSIYAAAFFYTGFVIMAVPSLLELTNLKPEEFRIRELIFIACLLVGTLWMARLFYRIADTIYVLSEYGIMVLVHGKIKKEFAWDDVAYIYLRKNCRYPSMEGFILAKDTIEDPFKTRWVRSLEKAEPNCLGWLGYSKEAEAALQEFAPEKIVDKSFKPGPIF